MSRIVFVQKEMEDRLGVMLLSAYLKSHGLSPEIIINPYRNLNQIKRADPDFIGFSVHSPSVDWSLKAARFLKNNLPGVKTIWGGPHPTFFPEIIEEEGVDLVCIGEGEKPLLQLLGSYDGTPESNENTPNFWVKQGKGIRKNQLIPLLTSRELSELPFCDRSHYSIYAVLRRTPHRRMWTSRGCPYSCAYCFNSNYQQIYRGLGKMVRQRSVDSVIGELRELKKTGAKALDFVDDRFLLSKGWTLEFCEEYQKHIRLPFVCNGTARQITPEIVGALKGAGCRFVNFAVESGVEKIRTEIYEKPIRDEDIYRAADVLHSWGMPFLTYNMIGHPDESLEDLFQTVKMNQTIKTTLPWCSILQPYPGTKLASRLLTDRGKVGSRFTYSYFQGSCLGDSKRRRQVSSAQKLFAYLVKSNTNFDRFLRLVDSRIIGPRVYPLLFYWYYGEGIRKRYSYSWPGLFKFWLWAR